MLVVAFLGHFDVFTSNRIDNLFTWFQDLTSCMNL